jgi:hypothetical protein
MNVSPYMFELGWLILGYLFALLLFLIVFFMIVRSAQKLYDSVIAPERALAIVRCGQNVKGVAHWMSPSDSLVVVHALAIAKAPVHVVAVVPAVENMVSKESYRPGDILTAMNGKTVEILNTDAEGRLILADALTYAQKMYAPKMLVDVATLTGAALVATGTVASPFTTNKPEYVMQMMGHSELVNDH